jgi:hypothetical protein
LQTRQQPLEEALCCLGVSPGLNEDVEHNAVLIDGAPEVTPWIRMKTSSMCHLSPGRGRRRRKRSAKLAANFLHYRRTVS